MSRRKIVAKTIDGFTVTELDIRIVSMPLYPTTDTVVNVFYGYYSDNKRIGVEGNLQLGDLISSSSKTALLNALTAKVGAVTEATLLLHQINDGSFYIHYTKSDGSDTATEVTGSYFLSSEYSAIISAVMTATSNAYDGFLYSHTLTVNSPSTQTAYPVTVTVHNTTGTNTATDIYLGSNVRSDWGDIRFRKSDGTYIPFGILSKTGSSVLIAFSADLVSGDNTFYLDYGKPAQAGDVTKFAVTTDQHYDSATTYVGRNLALTRLDNFKTRMTAYLPDVILEGGDKYGEVTTDSTTLLGFMQSVTDKHNELATALGIPHYLWGWGNHDFEHTTFADVQAQYNGLIGQVSGKLYATWSDDNFTYIVLDTLYVSGGQTHANLVNQANGYVNTDQLTWLTNTLAAATKPCIVMSHQLLGEEDTARIFLTKEQYHVSNRTDVRAILEASGKVVCVIHGHAHLSMTNIINGIPYITFVDVNDAPSTTTAWDTPNSSSPTAGTFNGRWSKMEIDRGARMITVIQETQINSTVNTVYEFKLPYKTTFDSDYGENIPAVFADEYGAEYNKPSMIIDPSDLYINNYSYIIAKACCLSDGDPILSNRSIKLMGLTSAANYGNASFKFATQSGTFKASFNVRLATQNTLYFKFFNDVNSSLIGTYLAFKPDGKLYQVSTLITTYALNTWYNIELIINQTAKTYEISINGTSMGTFSFYSGSIGSTQNKLTIVTETGTYFLDSFQIEPYTSPIPSITTVS